MDFKYKSVDGLNIRYIKRDGGDKFATILHGWGANLETIISIINSIPKNYTVLAYDAPGFGKSEDPKKVFGMDDYADFLNSFLNDFNVKKSILIGHSFGGKTIIKFANKYSEKSDKLILIDASGIKPHRNLLYHMRVSSFKIKKKIYSLSHDDMEEFYKNSGSEDYRAANEIMRKCFVRVVNEHLERDMQKITNETLLIWGENDEDTPLYMAKKMNELIKNSGLVLLNGAGHYSYLDKYAQFKRVMESFLGGV